MTDCLIIHRFTESDVLDQDLHKVLSLLISKKKKPNITFSFVQVWEAIEHDEHLTQRTLKIIFVHLIGVVVMNSRGKIMMHPAGLTE